jgi:hypothetical protein
MPKDDLSETAEEIQAYIKNEGFALFYTKPSLDGNTYFEWDNDKDWKGFFEVAKKEGITTIIGSVSTLTSDRMKELKEALSDVEAEGNGVADNGELAMARELVARLSKHENENGHYSFTFVKDGLEYSLTETTDWFEELMDVTRQFSGKEQKRPELGVRHSLIGYGGFSERPVPEGLKGKTEDDLAKELVEFVMTESSGKPTTREFRTLAYMYWQKLGASRFGLPGEYSYLIQKAELKAEKQIEIMELEREKKELPKLVDDCYDWCRENNLTKLIKTNVSAFLAEKDISLSRHSQDMLYQQVNMRLRSDR